MNQDKINKSEQQIYRKKCLEIVESVLTEEEVEKDLFVNNCLYMTRNDYNDICIERSLIDLCGYPFCTIRLSSNVDKNIFKSKQKYKIDSKNNKVYEIEERKQFCSNLCFKSSNYLKEQISEEPIYLRSGTQKPIRLYDKSCQQLGKEVVFDEQVVNQSKRLLKPKTDKTIVENKKLLSNEKQKQLIGFPYIKEEYLDQLKDQMKDLRINERLDSSKESEKKDNCLKHSDHNQSEQKSDEKSDIIELILNYFN